MVVGEPKDRNEVSSHEAERCPLQKCIMRVGAALRDRCCSVAAVAGVKRVAARGTAVPRSSPTLPPQTALFSGVGSPRPTTEPRTEKRHHLYAGWADRHR
jgi:hypothetical protein